MNITIDETEYEVKSVYLGSYIPTLTMRCGAECYVARSGEAAGEAARQYWKDMAEDDPEEFTCLVGVKTLVAWALGCLAGPGTAAVGSLEEWLDLWLDTPEEQWAGWDSTEHDTYIAPESKIAEKLGFSGDCVAYLTYRTYRKETSNE